MLIDARRLSRDVRVRRATLEALTVALTVAFVFYLVHQARQASGLDLGFMDDRAGFGVGDQFLTNVSGNDSRWAVYFAGIMNTIRITVFGMILAVIIGLVVGIARLSSNWLASRLALLFVEAIRNTPLLPFVVFWYTAMVLQLPHIRDSLSFLGVGYASNRAIALPWARPLDGAGAWAVVALGAFAVAAGVWMFLQRYEASTGQPSRPWRVSLTLLGVLAGGSYVAMGMPLRWDIPQVERFSYAGGLQLSPEFVGLLLALSFFNGAFVAEIVRGAIQSVPKGEREAAAALGLSGWQQMSLVVLPQALRAMLPPLATQCQALAKYSAVAIAIAFPDLMTVGGTIINNSGEAITMFIVMMLTYLLLNLLIALLMNGPQWRFQRGGKRRI
ncbi:MAG: ABC transporter permease subunit [Dehalococcoidia bacterium]|nr:ABC transporter permease subunit [Dehalococcoidia bacterium]